MACENVVSLSWKSWRPSHAAHIPGGGGRADTPVEPAECPIGDGGNSVAAPCLEIVTIRRLWAGETARYGTDPKGFSTPGTAADPRIRKRKQFMKKSEKEKAADIVEFPVDAEQQAGLEQAKAKLKEIRAAVEDARKAAREGKREIKSLKKQIKRTKKGAAKTKKKKFKKAEKAHEPSAVDTL